MSNPEPSELSVLLARLDRAERRAARAERRGRARTVLGLATLALGLTLTAAPPAAARQLGVTLASLASQVAQLRSDLKAESNARTSVDDDLQSAVAYLGSRAVALETKTKYLSVSGTDTVFSGTNVLVQSGSGQTDGPVNGLGNLIVGYNEKSMVGSRRGSHNLVVGSKNNYSSYGGVVFGFENAIYGAYNSILGGDHNYAEGDSSVVLGGVANLAGGFESVVCGGGFNNADGKASVVSGGLSNKATGPYSAVGGGESNVATGIKSVVCGGGYNKSDGETSVVSGGAYNRTAGPYSAIGGGGTNVESRSYGWKASPGLTN